MATLTDLKQLDDFYCSLIDLLPVDNFGLDPDVKDKLREYKHSTTDKKLKAYEKTRLSISCRQNLSRLDYDQPHTITEIWSWLSRQKPGASSQDIDAGSGNFRRRRADRDSNKPTPVVRKSTVQSASGVVDKKALLAQKQKVKRQSRAKLDDARKGVLLAKMQNRMETLKADDEKGVRSEQIKKTQRNLKRKLCRLKKLDAPVASSLAKRPKLDNGVQQVNTENGLDDTAVNKKKQNNNEKVIRNSHGQIVYSKFDFAVSGLAKSDKKDRKKEQTAEGTSRTTLKRKREFGGKDYKRLWDKVQHKENRLAELKEKDPEKALRIENDAKWNKALEKAQGVKIMDDKKLLKANMKRKETQKKKSKQEWQQRDSNVQAKIARQQEKRRENLKQRAVEKRQHKIDRAKRKGRIVIQ